MRVCCRLGLLDCGSGDELAQLLLRCAGRSMDDIWLGGEGEYPCLSILLSGDRALLRYYSHTGDNFHSLGHAAAEGDTEFFTGGRLARLPNRVVVPLEAAIACAVEFFHREERPGAIEWVAS